MAISNERGWLVLTTGNKSEMAVGYATLYGDMAGGYARAEGRAEDARLRAVRVPELRRRPRPRSAGGDRQAAVGRAAARTSATTRACRRTRCWTRSSRATSSRTSPSRTWSPRASTRPTVRRVIDLVDHAEYKRRQAPPGPRVTSRGFGKDRRMPITNRFRASGRDRAGQLVEPPRLGQASRRSSRRRAGLFPPVGRAGAARLAQPAVCAVGSLGKPRPCLAGVARSRSCFRSRSGSPVWRSSPSLPDGPLGAELARALPDRRRCVAAAPSRDSRR